MRFSVVETDFGDEETKNFGKRDEFVSLTSLYEIKTLATISGDFDNTENHDPIDEDVPPLVLSESNKQWLAIAAGDDISIFAISFDLEHLFTQPFKHGSNICGIGWLGDSHILAAVSSSMEVTFLSADLKAILMTIQLPSTSSCQRAFLSSDIVLDVCYLAVAREDGEVFTLSIPNWSLLSSATKETIAESCRQTFGIFETTQAVSKLPLSNIICAGGVILQSVKVGYLKEDKNFWMLVLPFSRTFSMNSKHGTIEHLLLYQIVPSVQMPFQISELRSSNIDFLGNGDTGMKFARVRSCCNNRFAMGLTFDGLFVVTDLWTFSTIKIHELSKDERKETFLDFMFVSQPRIDSNVETMAVVVQTDDRVEMQVRSMSNLEIIYCVAVNQKTMLLPVSETADRVILLVESFASKTLSGSDAIKVREIVEAQPEMKLQRLISRNQLDQAEQFAMQFGLDIQIVYVAKLNYHFAQAAATDSDEEFANLMAAFEKVKDHNMVGEVCFSGATTFNSYDKISSLLTYAKKRAITDSDTIDRLLQASYVLATYRLMHGPENTSYSSDSLWQNFVSGVSGEGEWHDLFIYTISSGLIKEARILWNRHIASILPNFNSVDNEEETEANLVEFFKALRATVIGDITCWRDIIAFLEFDFVPLCLSKMTKQVSVLLVDFLLELARSLESLDAENFPLNALHATSTFERILRKQVDETITGTRQAELAYVGCLLRPDATGQHSRLRELDRYSANLASIERLKTVYNCPLSYNTFVGLNSEQICHQILQQSVQNPKFMKQNVERFAKQYMAEHNLEPDGTLYRYIEAESSRSRGVVGASSAWNDHCLLISETISNQSVRSKAVCMIAKGSRPPWSRRLNEAVQSVLKNPQVDQDIKKSLECVCRRAELGEMLMAYLISIGMLDCVLSTEYNFMKLIRFMFTQDRFSFSQRLTDAVKAYDIYCELKEQHSSSVSLVRIYVLYAEHLQRVNSKELSVVQFLEEVQADKGEQVLRSLACRLVDGWAREIDTAVFIWTEESIAKRRRLISSAISVILRFMNQDPTYMQLYEQLRSIERLQENHNMFVTTAHLDSKQWRCATLKRYIEKQERSLTEIMAFSRVLGMTRDEASRLSIKLAIDSGNAIGTLTIIRDALRSVPEASPDLAEVCVHGCEFVLWRLQETVGNVEATPEAEIVEQSVDSIVILSRVLRILEPITSHSLNLQEAVARMHGYASIFLQVVNQCMLDDTTSDSSSSEKEKSKEEVTTDERSRIYGVRRRVGVYQMRNEGPLFSKMEAIAHIASVAQSAVGTEKLEYEARLTFYNEQVMRWNDLFNFLSLSNQDLLEFQARVYAASLLWWNEVEKRDDLGLRASVRNICIRSLQAHPCDLWTPCTLLSSLPPQNIEEVILELRGIVANRKSPQTMINFLRVVQFASILTQNTAHAKMLTDTFTKTLWAKRLGKACLPPTLPRKPIEDAIVEFAKQKVDPDMVVGYVDEFCGVEELPKQMLNYAITLVQSASSSNDEREVSSLLEIAHQTLKVKEVPIHPQKAFAAFRDILYTVNPYNYPVIYFIISQLKSTCDIEDKAFVDGCSSILNFIMERPRKTSICKDELLWFTNREKQMEADKRDPNVENFGAYCRCFFEQGTRPASFSATSSFSEENQDNNLYERDVLVITMPDMAKQRLPFHPFLYLAPADMERFLVPIVEKELDIYNVLSWQSMLRVVPWLKTPHHFSRTRLLSVAVGKISAEVIAKGQSLSTSEQITIKQLLEQRSRNAVVSCVSMCFKKLPLCETKILLLEIGRDVAQQWLMVPDESQPMDESERLAVEENVKRLGEAIEKYNTELILKRSGLYNEKTCDLTENPAELIGYLYSNCVDWQSEKERENSLAVIEELARANHLTNLQSIQEELVTSWLIADKADDAYAVDPNDTMGNVDMGVNNAAGDENEVFLLPFFDVSVDRIVYLLKLINMEKIMPELITYLRRDPSTVAGGYRTIVRAACVLLRAFSEQQLKNANYSQLKICVDLDAVLYGRLLELAHVDIPLDTFRRQEKSVVVRGLVAPGVRWTPQLTFLIASLIVDNDIADRSVVEMVLNRLQAAQKREMFITLLLFCRQEKKLHRAKNLAMLWARAADWSLAGIESVTPKLRDEFERWFYFAISCPVEGGRAFDSIRNALRARNYTVAAHLIGVVASYAQKSPPLDLSTVNPEHELVFGWTTKSMPEMMTSA